MNNTICMIPLIQKPKFMRVKNKTKEELVRNDICRSALYFQVLKLNQKHFTEALHGLVVGCAFWTDDLDDHVDDGGDDNRQWWWEQESTMQRNLMWFAVSWHCSITLVMMGRTNVIWPWCGLLYHCTALVGFYFGKTILGTMISNSKAEGALFALYVQLSDIIWNNSNQI